jgi:hypothetical protein
LRWSGKIPFPETHDFSSTLIRARASGALGFCESGIDLIIIVKQAAEFDVTKDMSVAAMIAYTNDVRSIGLETAKGLKLTECDSVAGRTERGVGADVLSGIRRSPNGFA